MVLQAMLSKPSDECNFNSSGANYRVYKTTANGGNFLSDPVAIT